MSLHFGRVFVAFTLAMAAAIAVTTTPSQAAKPSTTTCNGVTPTIKGTNSADTLVGTVGDDIIVGGAGDDVIFGRGGNDILCGGAGQDTMFGGEGDDTIDGGTHSDILIGNGGEDSLSGIQGEDVLYGLAGNDVLDGGNATDLLGGGSGDDKLAAGNGEDRAYGNSGNDSTDGLRGRDECTGEVLSGCEISGPDTSPNLEVAVSAPDTPLNGEFAATVDATAEAGVALIMLEANGEMVGFDYVGDSAAPTVQKSFTLNSADLDYGSVLLTAEVVDVLGNHVASDPEQLTVATQYGPEGPSVAMPLAEPTVLSELVPLLELVDAPILEFRHRSALEEPRPVPSQVASRAALENITVSAGPTDLVGGLYGRGFSLDDQVTMYRALSGDEDPLITAIRFDGEIDGRQQDLLASVAAEFIDIPERDGYEDSDAARELLEESLGSERSESDASSLRPSAKPDNLHDALAGAPSTATTRQLPATGRSAAVDVNEDVFWPSFGQFETLEYEIEIERRWWPDSVYKRAVFDHDLVWVAGVPDTFASVNKAYEHDFKIQTDQNTLGVRPLCTFTDPRTSLDDAFYAHRGDIILWSTNVPNDAYPYFDTDLSDGCDKEDLSVGILKPELLDDGLGASEAVDYFFTVNTRRGNNPSEFSLAAQRLSRRGDTFCAVIGTQNCTGLNTGAGNLGIILRSTGQLIPGIKVPSCFTWDWPPNSNFASSNVWAMRCTGDSDGDGWDDTIDCAPNDPTINPGAVDIPNDGIDQDCDGSDLIVGSGSLQITLIWDNDNDQDLHVTEPDGNRIWYQNQGPSASGGILDRDDNVGVCGHDPVPGGVENVYWPTGVTPDSGNYRIDIVEYAECGDDANWTLEVRVDGELKVRESGSTSGSINFTL